MKKLAKLLRVLSDEGRLRILALLSKRELCVCQLMAVLGVAQPLVSRNLTILRDAGFLASRRDGKLVFYSLNKKLKGQHAVLLALIMDSLSRDKTHKSDVRAITECTELQKLTGKCDMKTFLRMFQERRRRKDG